VGGLPEQVRYEKRKEGSIVTHAIPVLLLYFFHSHFLPAPTFKRGFDQRKGENYFFFYGSQESDFWFKKFLEKMNFGIKNFSPIGSLVSKL